MDGFLWQVKEWLCLNCQMQRAPGVPPTSSQEHSQPASRQVVPDPCLTGTKQRQPEAAPPPKKESGFFGFASARSRSPSPQPGVSGKVLGFGSSLFSTASNLISSAGTEKPSTTPPAVRKGSDTPQITQEIQSSLSARGSTVPENVQQIKTTEEKVSTVREVKEPSKVRQVTCPLCKVELNMGAADTPNYNTCTACKSTVCNLCGFNPAPHKTEVRRGSGQS